MKQTALTLLLLPAVLLCSLPAQSKTLTPELERAKTLLASPAERDVTEGGRICEQANNVAAVELLLDVLARTNQPTRAHLPPGHYRDIAWDHLTRITDPYARRRVEHELRTNRDSPDVRQWCAELLGIYGTHELGETLRRALRDRSDDVRRHAARALGIMRYPHANNELRSLTRDRNDFIRANALEALARIDPDTGVEPLVVAIDGDRSAGVRCALLGAAAEIVPDRIEELAVKRLADTDWRPRMQAVIQLGQIRSHTAVDALIRARRDGRPVVSARAGRALNELTGQPIVMPEDWERWWAENRETFVFPETRGVPTPPGRATVSYFGLPIESDHLAFLIDKSFMMRERLTSKSLPKNEAAQEELTRVLGLLRGDLLFNIYNYHTEVEVLSPRPVPLNPRMTARALAFANANPGGRAKDIWQVLEQVVSDPTIDTAYLLSSGEPDTGRYVHWNRVTRHLADLNRFHMVTVHCIAYSDNAWYREQLQKISEVTGGHFQAEQ